MSHDLTYPCSFCGEPCKSKSARRAHNRKCKMNVNREAMQKQSKRANEIFEAKVRAGIREGSRAGRIAAFECMADDLPDGAYFAMAEEFGLSPEDLI